MVLFVLSANAFFFGGRTLISRYYFSRQCDWMHFNLSNKKNKSAENRLFFCYFCSNIKLFVKLVTSDKRQPLEILKRKQNKKEKQTFATEIRLISLFDNNCQTLFVIDRLDEAFFIFIFHFFFLVVFATIENDFVK